MTILDEILAYKRVESKHKSELVHWQKSVDSGTGKPLDFLTAYVPEAACVNRRMQARFAIAACWRRTLIRFS
jgi:hypothetical protein